MGLGAIVVVGAELSEVSPGAPQGNGQDFLAAEPAACVEILGRSMMERTAERFVLAGVDVVSVLVSEGTSCGMEPFSTALENVEMYAVANVPSAVQQKLKEFSNHGIDHTFLSTADTYTETDLLDFFYFHREARQPATRACDSALALDFWVVDCAKGQHADLAVLLGGDCGAGVSYFIREYVHRLTHPRDLRRLVADVLRGRCAIRPSGVEVKPGIWMDESAEIHRRARIVAPAYIGRQAKVREDTLITRFSSIERDCYVDYGTVIEDSSILASTHIGIWLDVCHSLAKGSKLFNLERNVILEISDASIMRATGTAREARNFLGASHLQPVSADLRHQTEKKTPAPENWQFGANPIQG